MSMFGQKQVSKDRQAVGKKSRSVFARKPPGSCAHPGVLTNCPALLCRWFLSPGRGAPKVALRFTSGIAGVPELTSAEAFVEFEKNVSFIRSAAV